VFSQSGIILFHTMALESPVIERLSGGVSEHSPGSYASVGCIDKPFWNQITDAFCQRLRTGELGCEILCKEHSFYVFIAYKMPGEFPSKNNHC
jgi:hypothetical protein